jgi:branched-chain amino acid transport system permease protein
VVFAGLAVLTGSETFVRTMTLMFVYLVIVVGLYVFSGISGVLSFGHTAFVAVGAYATALATVPPQTKAVLLPDLPSFLAELELSGPLAMVVAIAAAAVLGLAIAPLMMRLSGMIAMLATFAILLIVNSIVTNWDSVTRGRTTMIGVPVNTTLELALLFAVLSIVAAYAFQESARGLRLQASREDEAAARAVGINVGLERAIAFVLSAGIVGAGGFLFAQFFGAFQADAFYLDITVISVAMLIVGGLKSLTGAVVGTVTITFALEGLRQLEDGISLAGLHVAAPAGLSGVGLAVLMLAILILRPNGLTNGREVRWPFERRRQRLQSTKDVRQG